jgi:hypothetical protein
MLQTPRRRRDRDLKITPTEETLRVFPSEFDFDQIKAREAA